MRRRISQRQARKAIAELERLRRDEKDRINRWTTDYPGGVHFYTATMSADLWARLDMAQRLQATVVCKVEGKNMVRFYAVQERK